MLMATQTAFGGGFETVAQPTPRPSVQLRSLVGSTLWAKFNNDGKCGDRLSELTEGICAHPQYNCKSRYRTTGTVALQVVDVVQDIDSNMASLGTHLYLMVSLGSDGVGYIKATTLTPWRPKYPRTSGEIASQCIFSEDPEIIAQRFQAEKEQTDGVRLANARAAAIEVAEKAHRIAQLPGVKIGMTREQVRNSNWGPPRHVNMTRKKSGSAEQWVYGDGEYLYFINGRLTTIQNRE